MMFWRYIVLGVSCLNRLDAATKGTKRFSNPQALSSTLAAHGMLYPQAVGLLNCLVSLVLASNCYLVHLNGNWDLTGHMCEYSNDGVGRTFMLSINRWCFSKLNINLRIIWYCMYTTWTGFLTGWNCWCNEVNQKLWCLLIYVLVNPMSANTIGNILK